MKLICQWLDLVAVDKFVSTCDWLLRWWGYTPILTATLRSLERVATKPHSKLDSKNALLVQRNKQSHDAGA